MLVIMLIGLMKLFRNQRYGEQKKTFNYAKCHLKKY